MTGTFHVPVIFRSVGGTKLNKNPLPHDGVYILSYTSRILGITENKQQKNFKKMNRQERVGGNPLNVQTLPLLKQVKKAVLKKKLLIISLTICHCPTAAHPPTAPQTPFVSKAGHNPLFRVYFHPLKGSCSRQSSQSCPLAYFIGIQCGVSPI